MSLDEIYGMFPNLEGRRDTQGTRLSGGEQQMLAVARTLRTGAKLLLLDEISEGLGAGHRAGTVADHSGNCASAAIPSSWSSRTFVSPRHLADRFYIMEHGRIVQTFAAQGAAAQDEHWCTNIWASESQND